jgi:hypothetical protein
MTASAKPADPTRSVAKSAAVPVTAALFVASGAQDLPRGAPGTKKGEALYGPHKTLYNRWKRRGQMGVFTRMMEGLSAGAERKTVMIDATYLKAHRTASSLAVKRGISAA